MELLSTCEFYVFLLEMWIVPVEMDEVSVSYYHIPSLLAHFDLLSTFLTEKSVNREGCF